MARRINIYPYRIPASPSNSSSTRAKLHRFLRKRHSFLTLVLLCTLLVYYYRSSHSHYVVRLASPALSSAPFPFEPLNETHSKIPKSFPLLPSNDPAFAFTPRRPCNALTLSLSLPPASNSSRLSTSPPVVQWISPSPPLPTDATLEDRITAFLDSPLSTDSVHSDFNAQTCSSPSIEYNTNQLHQRQNVEFWQNLDVAEIDEIRKETARVLRTAETQGRFKLDRGEVKRGLVWTAGNADTFDRVLVSLRLLRNTFDCHLPAEIFHFPSESPSEAQRSEFESLDARTISLSGLDKQASGDRTKSFHIKGSAMTRSSFTELLYLDSDSIPTRCPGFLFDSREFVEMGAVFWGDFWKDTKENAIWRVLGIQCRDEWSMESGQVLIDKARHLDALILLEHWLENWRFWFRFSDGDKDLLRYAFLMLRKRWSIPSDTLASASWTNPNELGEANRDKFAGHTMVQFGLESEFEDGRGGEARGRPLFVHGNLLKRIVGQFGREGGTWGRNLQLYVPPQNLLRNETVHKLGSGDETTTTSSSTDRVVSVDDSANVSPFTGLGVTGSYARTLGTNDKEAFPMAVERRRRTRAMLTRGLRTDFWDGHRGWSYVLGIQLTWEDELGGIDFSKSTNSTRVGDGGGGDESTTRGGRDWEEWVRMEERAECSKMDSVRNAVLSEIRRGREEEEEERKPEGEKGFIETVSWDDFDELREFEQRFYDAGGRANGVGF